MVRLGMTNRNGTKAKIDIAVLEQRVGDLENDMKGVSNNVFEILTNHLPHLKQDMESLKTRVNVATLINVGSVIAVGLIIKYL